MPPRFRAGDLRSSDVPAKPGVYAWYRRGRAATSARPTTSTIAFGAATSARAERWDRPPFRRNVAEHLGFASSADIKAKRVTLTPDQLATVRAWIVGCRVAWVVCPSVASAIRTEIALTQEWMPPLTKISSTNGFPIDSPPS